MITRDKLAAIPPVAKVAIKDGIPITADKNPFINPTINPKKKKMKI